MNRIAIAVLAAALGSTAASAQGLRIHTSCIRHICTTTVLPADAQGLGKTIDVPMDPDDALDRAARIQQWEEYCQPKIIVDRLGVSRYRYAHKNCDVGGLSDAID